MSIRRLLMTSAAVVVVFSVALGGFWLVKPIAFRLVIFQPLREVRLFTRELGGPVSWPKIERLSLPSGEKVHIEKLNSNDIEITADLYRPDIIDDEVPGVLFLHGSSPYGRQAALVRMVGTVFEERGWIMLAPDARGYGDTDDPDEVDDATAWDVSRDVQRILTYLAAIPGVDAERIIVVGHSVGAGHALEGALDDDRITALVLIGPARYLDGKERTSSLWTRVRFSADRKLKAPVSEKTMIELQQRTNIAEFAAGPLSHPGHVPMLIIDGEREGRQNHAYLRSIVDKIAAPVEYRTLPETGHYCGVRSFFGSTVVYYREDLFQQFLNVVDDFIETYAGVADHLNESSAMAPK